MNEPIDRAAIEARATELISTFDTLLDGYTTEHEDESREVIVALLALLREAE